SATIVESPQARSTDRAAIREDLPEDTDSDLPIEASWGTPVKILKAIPPERADDTVECCNPDTPPGSLSNASRSRPTTAQRGRVATPSLTLTLLCDLRHELSHLRCRCRTSPNHNRRREHCLPNVRRVRCFKLGHC